MEGMGWFMTIILGGLAGWIAEKVMKFDTGLIMNIILGIVGAVVGNLVLNGVFKLSWSGSILGQLVVAVLGACVIILLYRQIRGKIE